MTSEAPDVAHGSTKQRGLGKTVLITGASGGIGYELALLFARDKYDLILVARSKDKLEAVADELERNHGIQVRVLPKDLSRPQAPVELVSELDSESARIDVLVNNAGFGIYGPFAENGLADQLEMVQLNVVALTQLTGLLVVGMLERGEGKVLNVASLASFQSGPLMAVYAATKAYVLSFSEALANELAGSGVTVTALCPGPTETGFFERAGMQGSSLLLKATMDARTVAEAGYRALAQGKSVVIPGSRNRLLLFAGRLAPRWMVTHITRRMLEVTS